MIIFDEIAHKYSYIPQINSVIFFTVPTQNLISHGKFAKDRTKDQTEISSKSPQKKSLLNRVLSRKESSGKKYKSKASSNPPSPSTKEEISTYDNASDLTPNRESPNEGNELPEYNCPPPPRPVYYMKSTTPNGLEQGEELYDDVSTCREQYKNQVLLFLHVIRVNWQFLNRSTFN